MCISKAISLINWINRFKIICNEEVFEKYGEEFEKWPKEHMTRNNLHEFFKENRNLKYLDCIDHILSKYLNIPIEEFVPHIPKNVEIKVVEFLDEQLSIKKAHCCTHYGFILTKCLEAIGEYELAYKHRMMFKNRKWSYYEDTWARAFPNLSLDFVESENHIKLTQHN